MRAVACFCVLSLTSAAWSSPPVLAAEPAEVCAAGPEAAAATPEAKARAATNYRAGVEHFKARRFEDAVIAFAKAHRIDPSPVLMFNMARAFEELKRFPQAVAFYNCYLQLAPEAADGAAVRQSIAALEGLATPRRSESADAGPGAWPWVVFGTGVALVGVGIGFGVLAGDRADTLDRIEADPARYSLSDWNTAKDEGKNYALGADLMLGLGLAAAAGGLAWWLLADDGAQVGLTPTLGGLGLVGTF